MTTNDIGYRVAYYTTCLFYFYNDKKQRNIARQHLEFWTNEYAIKQKAQSS